MGLRHIRIRVQNARISVSAALHHFGTSPVPFLCECDDEACGELVALPLAEYEQHRADGGYVLAPGHTIREEPTRRLGSE